MPDKLLNLKEAGEVLGCSAMTARRRVLAGEWPCTRPTNKIQFSEADIAAIIEMSSKPAKRPTRQSSARPARTKPTARAS